MQPSSFSSSSTSAASSSWSPPTTLSRDALGGLFLRVAAQLEALQPQLTSGDARLARPTDVSTAQLLPRRECIHEILCSNARFRPADECSTTKRPPPPPVAVSVLSSGRAPRQRPPIDSHTVRHAPVVAATLSPPAVEAVVVALVPQVLTPVGGRARVFQAQDLSRAKHSMKKRSLALTNLQTAASTGAHATAPSWDLKQTAATTTALSALASASTSTSSMTGKQALIAELVRRTSFSTQHIFHMSRKFKEMAGPAKSAISFGEFRQLLAIGVDADYTAFQEIARADLRTISATISASESFLRRLFATFDGDSDGRIDFREFVLGLNGFVKGSLEDKVDALFDVYQLTPPPVRTHCSGGGDSGGARAEEAATHPAKEITVAISDLLGLFQGDRQLYQEIMWCVDEYFARLELNSDDDGDADGDGDEGGDRDTPLAVALAVNRETSGEGATTIGLEDFVAASLVEPRLLETITRPTSSLVYSEDAALRERLKAFVDAHALSWRTMVELQRRVLRSLAPSSGRSLAEPAYLPPTQVLHILNQCGASADDYDANLVLRAYMAGASTARAVTPSTAPLVDLTALLQDLAVVLLHPTTQALDADAKARYYFERFDANGDGLLSRHELVAAVCAGFAHFGPSLTEVVRVLEDEDADQDGELTKPQYLRAARRSPLILASLYTCL